jgi:hypothetical protein
VFPGFARGVVLPVYEDQGSNLVATVKADCLFSESRRMGFLQVRLLSQGVAEKVRVDFIQPPKNPRWWAHFCGQLRALAHTDLMEIRGFACFFPNETAPRLQSKRMRFASGNTDAVTCYDLTVRAGTNSWETSRAQLHLEGETAGRFFWSEADHTLVSYDLFSNCSPTNLPSTSLTKSTP